MLDCRQKVADLAALTGDAIRAAARETNADFPEALAMIDAGRPVLLVHVLAADRAERTYRVVVSPSVMASQDGRGVSIGAGDPVVLVNGWRPRDGRLSFLENARRLVGAQLGRARVAVEWIER
jgi:hypothetical protein